MSNGAKARSDPLIGQVILGRYRPTKVLGQGGMGKVYLAEDLNLKRKVALKVLLESDAQDAEFLARFRREALQIAKFNYQRIVTVHDFVEMPDGSLFIVMAHVEGQSLKEIITGPLKIKRAVRLAIQIAEGLQAIHQVGSIHRDIKPSNIMVCGPEEKEAVQLIDFGIARPLDSDTQLTHTGAVLGTPLYMAPEISREGQYSQQSDLYAWGIVLYEMLAGKVPFTASTPEALALKHRHESPVPLRQVRPEVPVAIEQLVAHTLEKKPEDRPENMQEVITILRAAEKYIPEEEDETGPTVVVTPLVSRRRWLTWLGGGLSVAVAGALAVWVVISGTVSLLVSAPPPVVDSQTLTDHLNIGKFYLDRGEYPEAIAEFEAAKALAPGHQEIGELLDRAQQAKQAEEELLLAR